MVTKTAPAPWFEATRVRVCTVCHEPEDMHSHVGEHCPTRDSGGSLTGFHWVNTFTPPQLKWKAGDTYTRLDYDTLVIVGVIQELSGEHYAQSIELVAGTDGRFIETSAKTVELARITRMVPA